MNRNGRMILGEFISPRFPLNPLFETPSVKQAHESHQLTLFNFQRAEKLWTENEK